MTFSGDLINEMILHPRKMHAYKTFCMFASGSQLRTSEALVLSSVKGDGHAHIGGLSLILIRQLRERMYVKKPHLA